MRRLFSVLLLFLLLSCLLFLPAAASGEDPGSPLADALPDQIRSALPGDVLEELEKGEDADPGVLSSLLGGTFLPELLRKGLSDALSPFLRTVGCSAGLVLLSSLVGLLSGALGGDGGKPMQYCVTLLLSVSVWKLLGEAIALTTDALTSAVVFLRALLPTMLTLYAAGGNLSAAASEEGMLLLFFEGISFLCSGLLLPLVRLLFVMAVLTRLSPENDLSGLAGAIRKCFLTSITFLSMLLGLVLGIQHTLAARADGVLTRTVRFASSTLIPVVGGRASEAMRTAMASVTYLRSAVGGVGTAGILVLLLSPLLRLFVWKAGFSLASGIAGALGCPSERAFFGEACGILDLAIGLLTLSGLVLLFALSLLIHTAAALG